MQRIHFSTADLARTRLRTSAGPLVETAFAAGLLSRGVCAPYARWHRQLSNRLPLWSGTGQCGGHGAEVDDLVHRALRYGEAEGQLPGGTRQLAWPPGADLLDVWRAAVAPYWENLLVYLEAECEARGRTVMAGGVEQLLTTMHPRITWTSPVLEIPGGPDEDVVLGGTGLVLTPSVFLNHRPAQLIRARDGGGRPILVVSAPPQPHEAAALWAEPDDTAEALAALVGQTRAAALRLLRAACTTSELADRLGISRAGASQHATVLRRTGLITSRRVRNSMLHTVTPLGLALLDGRPGSGPGQRSARTTRDPSVLGVTRATRSGTAADRRGAEGAAGSPGCAGPRRTR
ncbi:MULTISPECIES: ArsR/SmtB family transcription factor [unclassified Streptomyces]|uniref:ArsR/SmtB family transcription factor n=1 Tax=unclassified Streptomyces TaxID=2593676 RepID=UPI003806D3CD